MDTTITLEVVRTAAGTIHRRIVLDGIVMSHERCNLDDAQLEKVGELYIGEAITGMTPDDFCKHCFVTAPAAEEAAGR